MKGPHVLLHMGIALGCELHYNPLRGIMQKRNWRRTLWRFEAEQKQLSSEMERSF